MSKPSVPNTAAQTITSESGVTYSLEVITPEIAEVMLTHNTKNRKQRPAGLDKYARDMEGDEWVENGDAIRFAVDGTLLDGQHRLTAVVSAGVSITALVVRGLPVSAQKTIDSGFVRPMAEAFEFEGIAHSKTAAAVTRRVLLWQHGQRSNAGGNYQPSKTEMLDAWRTDPVIRTSADAARQMQGRKQIPASIIGLTWWLFSQVDPDGCAVFWQGLYSGSDLSANNPIHVVRERIIKQNAQPGRVQETVYLAWVIKAWNLWRADKKISPTYRGFDFKVGEKFPEPR